MPCYARKMAAHLGIRLHEIEINPNVVDMLPRVVDVLDDRSAILPPSIRCSCARPHVKQA
jgi:hypothetical protein